jgi:hypothetical protein
MLAHIAAAASSTVLHKRVRWHQQIASLLNRLERNNWWSRSLMISEDGLNLGVMDTAHHW